MLFMTSQESDDDAIYCDARIVKINRRPHDVRGCRCIFVVRYEDDEDEVTSCNITLFYVFFPHL